jgi:hypothetical protein
MKTSHPLVDQARRSSARSVWTGTIFSTFVFVSFSTLCRVS